ncbi:MAG: DUF1848 domain-containing protein [Lachnospiraceae bacterium]|nr:DUF1848 domain-containing protein [Lachnospiraceae bacterium]
MIISVSRRTDIPNYYSEWFYNRIKDGYVYVRNPMNPRQVRTIDLSPDAVDCFVFWSKNPEPMLDRLDALSDYNYYFQFTLTGYGRDIECNVPHKREKMIPVFQKLSETIGKERVIWRYDPILFNGVYTPEYHWKAFGQIADSLNGYTEKCVISFVDAYAKNKKNLCALGAYTPDEYKLREFAAGLSKAAVRNGMTITSCAEAADLSDCGIGHNCCIDKELIEDITGRKLDVKKDRNQRKECGCVASVDIGAYNTCRNNCKYCYANYSFDSVVNHCERYDPLSPILCGTISEDGNITAM